MSSTIFMHFSDWRFHHCHSHFQLDVSYWLIQIHLLLTMLVTTMPTDIYIPSTWMHAEAEPEQQVLNTGNLAVYHFGCSSKRPSVSPEAQPVPSPPCLEQ